MTIRIIARLDVKPPNLVKGIHLEGFRVLGKPSEFARQYYQDGIDEISYQDVVASLYYRNSVADLVRQSAEDVFVPLSVGGGLRSVEDMRTLLRSGADKVIVNTGAILDPTLISRGAETFGSQAIVVAVEVARLENGWTALTDGGRERTNLNALDWIAELTDLGAGEVLVTSVDRDGTKRGPDLQLLEATRLRTDLPLIAHGGFSSATDVVQAAQAGVDAVALASAIHYNWCSIGEIKESLLESGFEARL